MWGNHFRRAPRVDSAGECGSAGVSPSPLEGKAVQCTEGSKWVINRERGEKKPDCGMQGRLCLRLGVSLPLPPEIKGPSQQSRWTSLQPSLLGNKSLYLSPCHTSSPRRRTKDSFNRSAFSDHGSDTQCVCNPNQCLGGTSGNRVQSGTLEKQGQLCKSGFFTERGNNTAVWWETFTRSFILPTCLVLNWSVQVVACVRWQ